MQRNLEIDNLRSFAILTIAILHTGFLYNPTMHDFFINYGIPITMVDLAFVISGYVISSVLIPPINQQNTPTEIVTILKIFAIKRLSRIYPAMWAVFLIVLIFAFVFSEQPAVFSTPLNTLQAGLMLLSSTFNFFFITNYHSLALAPYWSLAIEEQFYILFPIFLLLTKNDAQRIKTLIGMILIITFILRPLTLYFYGSQYSLYFSQFHFDAIMYGSLLYLISQQPWFPSLKPVKQDKSLMRILIVATLLFVIIGLPELGYSPAVYLPICYLGCSALVLCAILESNIIAFPSMVQKFLSFLAPRSYTLYLIHLPILLLTNLLVTRYIPSDYQTIVTKVIIATLAIMIINELLFRFILQRYMNAGYRIAKTIKERHNQPTQA